MISAFFRFFFASTVISPALLSAKLVLENQVVKVNASPAAEHVDAFFRYENQGKTAIKLTSIEVHCECLGAEADKAVLQPGESGVIRARFAIGDLTGVIRKSITLTTNHPDQAEIPLEVEVNIPEWVVVTPQMLSWEKGGPITTQSYEVKMLGDAPIHLKTATSTRQGFQVSIETKEEGKSYLVHVTPTSTQEVAMGAIRLVTDSKLEKFQRQLVFFKVAVLSEIEAEKEKP